MWDVAKALDSLGVGGIEDGDRSGRRFLESQDRADESGLSGSVRSDDGAKFSGREIEIDIKENGFGVVGNGEVTNGEGVAHLRAFAMVLVLW